MSEKPLETAFFMKDARRIEDLAEFRKECIKKRKCAKLYIIEKTIELSKIDYENLTLCGNSHKVNYTLKF